MENNSKSFFKPKNIDEVFEIIENLNENYIFIAGGVTVNWRGGKTETIISLENVIENDVLDCCGSFEIGAGMKLASLKKNKLLNNINFFTGLIQASELIASPQIRNMATIGGNFISAFDFSDTLGFFYLTEPDIKIINRFGVMTQPFKNMLNAGGQFAIPKDTILNSFVYSAEMLGKYVRTGFHKETRVQRDLAVLNITAGKKNNGYFDIAIGSCWVKTTIFKDVKNFEDIKKNIEILPEPKSDVRASSEYRKKIIAELCYRLIDEM